MRTIAVDTFGVNPVDFGLTPETAERLYLSGRRSAEQFLATWDWETYAGALQRRAVPLTVTEAVADAIAGPTLLNWTGYARVEVEGADRRSGSGDGDGDGDGISMPPGAKGVVRIVFSVEPSDTQGERPIDIRDGENATKVPFRVVPTSDRVRFDDRAAEAVVPRNGGAEAILAFTCPKVAGIHRLWVQIRQRNRTVQILPASVNVEPGQGVAADGR